MIVNRHNYEEFFLLYVDNELNDSDRKAVEQFVQENLDLAEEMEMLKQAVLPAENIAFEQKEILFNKAEGISINNYEEYFLLSVDKELTKQETEDVEKFVLTHPELQDEFTLLEQTRLEAEPIFFAGKEKLYKKEKKDRPVIFLSWARMSAAAAIIGVAVMAWFFSQQNNLDHLNYIVAATDAKPAKTLPTPVQQSRPDSVQIEKSVAAGPKAAAAVPENAAFAKVKSANVGKAIERNNVFAANRVKNVPSAKNGVEVEDEKVTDMPVQDKKAFEETIASARIDNSASSNVVRNDPKNEKSIDKTFIEQNNSLAKQVVYRELNTQEDDEEKSIYIGSAQINKNKLKGLFKKATSFLGVRNNDNDGEKTLRIAGFEIKSK